jgi:hypothetical protein
LTGVKCIFSGAFAPELQTIFNPGPQNQKALACLGRGSSLAMESNSSRRWKTNTNMAQEQTASGRPDGGGVSTDIGGAKGRSLMPQNQKALDR